MLVPCYCSLAKGMTKEQGPNAKGPSLVFVNILPLGI